MITPKDQNQIKSEGRSTELIQRQQEYLIGGNDPISGINPASNKDGIFQLSLKDQTEAFDRFKNQDGSLKWTKFVPASGLASRMFMPLFSYLKAKRQSNFNFSDYLESEYGNETRRLIKETKKLPFYGIIKRLIYLNEKLNFQTEEEFFNAFANKIIQKKGLNYPYLPKGLIPFFTDNSDKYWTAFEAQLMEALKLGNRNTTVHLHFTIAKEHRALFDSVEKHFRNEISKDQNEQLIIEYSYQHRLTDTPYFDTKNNWIRNSLGDIAFRKGGHGALLKNLNQLDAHCVWIKNIDNIKMAKDNASAERWLKILGGKLILIQEVLFKHLKNLSKKTTNTDLYPIVKFIKSVFDENFTLKKSSSSSYLVLYDYLNRPIRVCGMIPNAGAKGGGAFWKTTNRGRSLQIIEGLELDSTSKEGQNAIHKSSHFNPVMMVCGITNYEGEKFSLYDFRDEKRFMVSKKESEGSMIKILEWPGLWNGGMAEWNSIFIEIPSDTFHPIKTLVDFLE